MSEGCSEGLDAFRWSSPLLPLQILNKSKSVYFLKKNLNASRPSEHALARRMADLKSDIKYVVFLRQIFDVFDFERRLFGGC